MLILFFSHSGSDAYKDFSGQLQLLGSRTKEFAVCASLSSTNVSLIPVNTSLKFVVVPIPLTSAELINQLSRCQMFIQSFDQQIRRIIIAPPTIPSHQSRSKSQSTLNGKRLSNIDQQLPKEEDQITSTDDDCRSGQSTEKKRNGFRQQRAISTVSIHFHITVAVKKQNNISAYFSRVSMIFHHDHHQS